MPILRIGRSEISESLALSQIPLNRCRQLKPNQHVNNARIRINRNEKGE